MSCQEFGHTALRVTICCNMRMCVRMDFCYNVATAFWLSHMRVCTPAATSLTDIVAVSSATRHIFARLRHDSKYQISISVFPTAHLYRAHTHTSTYGLSTCIRMRLLPVSPKRAFSIEFAGKHQLIRVAVACDAIAVRWVLPLLTATSWLFIFFI